MTTKDPLDIVVGELLGTLKSNLNSLRYAPPELLSFWYAEILSNVEYLIKTRERKAWEACELKYHTNMAPRPRTFEEYEQSEDY